MRQLSLLPIASSLLQRKVDVKCEHSFGIIPIRLQEEKPVVFLIQHQAGHWGFPKGHPEADESAKETAKRELFEETGLIVDHFLACAPLQENYHFVREGVAVDKTVTYFLAQVQGEERLQRGEIVAGKWVLLKEAPSYLTFSQVRQVSLEAYTHFHADK